MVDADVAGERWRNALAELEYAERHGSPSDEVAQLAKGVIEARVAMFQAGIARARAVPPYLLPPYLLPAYVLPAYVQVVALP
ncbi:MAG TPA: hypothetical protein VIJ31_14390 [Acidothermaceae bacterium]